MCGYTRADRIRNEVIRDIIKVSSIENKIREIRVRWFGHVKKRSVDTLVRRCERINIPKGRRGMGRQKKSLDEVIRDDLKVVELMEDMAHNRRI